MSIQGQEGTPSGSAEGPHPGGMGQELQEDVMERLKGYGGFLRFFFFFPREAREPGDSAKKYIPPSSRI